jgi:hypothetical protein
LSDPRSVIEARCRQRVARYFEQQNSDDPLNLHRSLKSTVEQVVREYEHRSVIELIQNGHDAIPSDARDGVVHILLDDDDSEFGTLYVANTGRPFATANFDAICDVGRSDKGVDEGIGNKGVGFKSVLELCDVPRIYSSHPDYPGKTDDFEGYCFTFASSADFLALAGGVADRAEMLRRDFFKLLLPVPLADKSDLVRDFARRGFATVIELRLKSAAARAEVDAQLETVLDSSVPILLFLRRLARIEVQWKAGALTSCAVISTPTRSSWWS